MLQKSSVLPCYIFLKKSEMIICLCYSFALLKRKDMLHKRLNDSRDVLFAQIK